MEFKNKNIFIISRELWGGMLMSKQHYAIELGKRNNNVFFVNHPDQSKNFRRGEIQIEETGFENVVVVKHRFFHPYFLKIKLPKLFYFLTKWHIRRILKRTGVIPDVAWLFDIGNTIPLMYFPSSTRKIYMPVDGPYGSNTEKDAIKGAEIVISVTNLILNQYDHLNLPRYCINHGVAEEFINESPIVKTSGVPIRVGYSGSIVRNDLDFPTFVKIISNHPDIIFEFWGENDPNKSNIHLPQDVGLKAKTFLNFLKNSENVILHGALKPVELAAGLKRMDVLLIAYDIVDDQNHHKVLEYLASGRVIVSSYLSSYIDLPDLVEMLPNTGNNDGLPSLFRNVIDELDMYNSILKQNIRIEYAKQFTYSNQIKKIEFFLKDVK